eukprot:GFUD01038678.1.p1 GENE.GFUD01038678.1~~GFUD01038678.1.p1  ORF type:complete len:248 (-),score=64.66 GFUD01038678.1:98-841(-)
MNFPAFRSVSALKDNIVRGNIVESNFVLENIEDSGFNAEEIKSSTKKNLDEDLKNVWSMLNNIHKDQINRELEWFEENRVAAIKASNKRQMNVQLDGFEEEKKVRKVESTKPVSSTCENFTEDSGIFKMSMNEISFSRTSCWNKENVESNFYWNEGDFSTNAVSEPWVVKDRAQDFEISRDLAETINSDETEPWVVKDRAQDFEISRDLAETINSDESLALLSPPGSKHLPFKLQNLPCTTKITRCS